MNEGHIIIAVAVVSGFLSVLGFLWRMITELRKMDRKFDFVLIEHEMLILDYAKRMGLEMNQLPTRTAKLKV